jgi:hypothetical protein
MSKSVDLRLNKVSSDSTLVFNQPLGDAYRAPKTLGKDIKILKGASSGKYSTKKMSIFEETAKNKNFIPGPGNYIKVADWNRVAHKVCRSPGAFSPGTRPMITTDIMKIEKQKPGPNKYDTDGNDRY